MSVTQEALDDLAQAQILIGKALRLLTDTGPAPLPAIEPIGEVFYGKNGYTDDDDPRLPTAMTHAVDASGKLSAVWLTVLTQPYKKYQAVEVRLLPQDESCNIYIEVQNPNGAPLDRHNARMLTGWQESATSYDKLIDAPQSPGNLFMGHNAIFFPPNLGPLGAVMVNDQGQIDSDIVGSMGLPGGQHCSYRVIFRARS